MPIVGGPYGRSEGLTCLRGIPFHPAAMFVVTEAEAAAIRAVFDQEGELSAAIELRRLFPGVTDDAKARLHARTIAGRMPLPAPVRPVTQLHPRKERESPRFSGFW
jgi:hypothetical protein